MKSTFDKDSRSVERFTTNLTASVKARENEENFWKEDTTLINFSRVGASFYVGHQCRVGQLVSLLFPMPKHLRFYDQDEINYRVWGLVQHCSGISSEETADKYHIGVAFVGKTAPSSYYQNPQQTYRICGITENGFWKITENEKPFVIRKDSRFPVSVEVTIQILNEEEAVIAEEKALTENISFGGAAVLSNLSVEAGNSVIFNCEKYAFSSPALVRHKSFNEMISEDGEEKHSKLHLEFIDGRFPLEQVKEI